MESHSTKVETTKTYWKIIFKETLRLNNGDVFEKGSIFYTNNIKVKPIPAWLSTNFEEHIEISFNNLPENIIKLVKVTELHIQINTMYELEEQEFIKD